MGVAAGCCLGFPWGHGAQNLGAGTLRTGLQGSGSRGKVGRMLCLNSSGHLLPTNSLLEVVMFFQIQPPGSPKCFSGKMGDG